MKSIFPKKSAIWNRAIRKNSNIDWYLIHSKTISKEKIFLKRVFTWSRNVFKPILQIENGGHRVPREVARRTRILSLPEYRNWKNLRISGRKRRTRIFRKSLTGRVTKRHSLFLGGLLVVSLLKARLRRLLLAARTQAAQASPRHFQNRTHPRQFFEQPSEF